MAALADGVTLIMYREEVPKFKAAWAGAGVVPIKTSNPNMAEITRIVDFLNMYPLAILLVYPLKIRRLRVGKGSTPPKPLLGSQSFTGVAKSCDAQVTVVSLESLQPNN